MSAIQDLNQKLCVNQNNFCDICFKNSPHKNVQNPPNIMRNPKSPDKVKWFFVFEKPNNNDAYRDYAPITIHDPRGVFNNPTKANLLKILNAQDTGKSDPLDIETIHITNAIKCDKCSQTGQSGRIAINPIQTKTCLENYLFHEIKILKPELIVVLGSNTDKVLTGKAGKTWAMRTERINGKPCKVVRIPHTSPTSFNTHGKCGAVYHEKLPEIFPKSSI